MALVRVEGGRRNPSYSGGDWKVKAAIPPPPHSQSATWRGRRTIKQDFGNPTNCFDAVYVLFKGEERGFWDAEVISLLLLLPRVVCYATHRMLLAAAGSIKEDRE